MSEFEGNLRGVPTSDRELIENFVRSVQAWAPASLTSIVLYGSVAKGIFPEEYDVDIVLFFSNDFDHQQFYAEVYSIIAALKPHRDMHVVLKWEAEVEPAYRQLIRQEGITLYP